MNKLKYPGKYLTYLSKLGFRFFVFNDISTFCYITYDMDFRFVPSDPVCFDKLSRCD